MLADPIIHHRLDCARFELTKGGSQAVLEYHLSNQVMTIHHTFVPVALRGQNIAGQLAKAAFDYARANQLKVVPSCSYIEQYARRFPAAGELILKV